MPSALRTVRRLALPAIVLIGLAAGAAAGAAPLKPEDIEANRQSCMVSCIQKKGENAACTAYCDCGAKGMGEQISQEEYDAGKVALATQQQPAQATVDKLAAIAKSCRALLQ